ncbi:MAG: hypothetical protein J5600_02825, partial [Desulfovibrio sp.]|nr:hypothetical protein [Desulfovibrio sp.]
ASKERRDPSDALPEFLASDTATLLFDETSNFWWCGPSDIAENYRQEQVRKGASPSSQASDAHPGPQDES